MATPRVGVSPGLTFAHLPGRDTLQLDPVGARLICGGPWDTCGGPAKLLAVTLTRGTAPCPSYARCLPAKATSSRDSYFHEKRWLVSLHADVMDMAWVVLTAPLPLAEYF